MEKFLFIRISKYFAIVLTLALLLLCGCGHNDEPVDPENPENPELPAYQPLEGLNPSVPLLKGYDELVGYTLWPTEKIPDGNLTGDGFSYNYWFEHKNEAQSLKELLALCEVPQEQLAAMSTRNLVLTCYIHPYNSIYNAYDNQYLGVMTAMRANCWQELMIRETGVAQLLDLYCELTYPKILSSINVETDVLSYLDYKVLEANHWNALTALTLVMMTAVDRNAFTPEQLTRIAGEIFNKIDNLLTAEEGIHSYVGSIRYPYMLGAFIAYRYDRSLTPLELSLVYDFTGFFGMPGHDSVKDRYFTTDDVANATKIITQSLERIEQGSLLTTTS